MDEENSMRPLSLILLLVTVSLSPARAADNPAAASFAEKVSIDISDLVPFRQAIDRVFAGSRLSYVVDPKVPNVGVFLSVKDVKRETALGLLVRIAGVVVPGLSYVRDGANVTIWIDPGRPEALPAEFKPDPRLQKKLTLDLKEMPLRKAASALAAETGVQVVVLPHVADFPVSISLKDQTGEEAARELVKQLNSRYGDGIASYFEPEGEAYVVGIRRVAAR